MTDSTEALVVADAQRREAKRASLDLLKNKRRAEQEFEFTLDNGDGPETYTMLMRALPSREWDKLVTDNPPTKDQKADAMTYNPDKFGPALLSRVVVDPVMTENDWADIWLSSEWSKGELQEIFWSAVGICNRGLDVTPTGPASA